MQKLITIYLDNASYMEGKWIQITSPKQHGIVEEHLQSYLADGWRIVSVCGIGGAENPFVRGWFAVVLEKPA